MAVSASRLRQVVDSAKGKPALVAGSGWSLNHAPDSWYRTMPVRIGVNASYRFFLDRALPLPHQVVSGDTSFAEKHPDFYTFFPKDKYWFFDAPQVCCKREWGGLRGYSLDDTGDRIVADGSSTHAAIHFALLLGCNPIYLIGCDLCAGPKDEVYACKTMVRSQSLKNYKRGWETMIPGFEVFARLTEPGRILDCSPDGAIRCFPKTIPWT